MKKRIPLFGGSTGYDPSSDGSLDAYLRRQFDNNGTYCLFRGYKHFRMLWKEGYVIPGMTAIRLMYNFGREDEHYLVIDEKTLEGIILPAHAGKPGRHLVRKILNRSTPLWEAHDLDEQKRNGSRD
jgi:hypothetical protein